MKRGLGKGLEALITAADTETKGVLELKINEIEPDRQQPRKYFDDEKLESLAESIKKHGVVQPLIVQQVGKRYKIAAGERRWRAARMAGLQKVPVIVREITEKQAMEIALIENLQREDLNPIEEAEAYMRLIDEFGMTQEEISITVGKSRPAIANAIRLLSLQETIKENLISGKISSGHARTLLALEDREAQLKAMEEVIKKELNVRATEALVKRINTPKVTKKEESVDVEYKAIEARLREIFGTKVMIMNNKNKGKILIEYYSEEEFDRIIDLAEKLGK